MINPLILIFVGAISVFLYAAYKVFKQTMHEAYQEKRPTVDDANIEIEHTQLPSRGEADLQLDRFISDRPPATPARETAIYPSNRSLIRSTVVESGFALKPLMADQSLDTPVLEKAIYPYSTSLAHFESELRRAKRYERDATLLVIGLKDDQLNKLVTKENESRFSLLGDPESVANVLVGILSIDLISDVGFRETDVVTYNKDAQSYVILLPATPAEGAKTFLKRLRQKTYFEKFWPFLSAGLAQYPTDGENIDSLFHLAISRRESLVPLPLGA